MAKIRTGKKSAPKTDGTWFKRGSAGLKAADQDQALRDEEMSRRVFRYNLKPGESGKIIFLDGAPDDPFLIDEHSMYPSKRGPFTCPGDHTECALCEAGESKRRVCALTVLDLRAFTSRAGKKYSITKKLMAFPNRARKKFFKRVEKQAALKGDVTYSLWEFSRDTEDECGTGETHEFQNKRFSKEKLAALIMKRLPPGTSAADAKKLVAEYLTPFDYMKIFAPLSTEQLRQIAGGSSVVGSDTEEDYEDEDFDVEKQEDLDIEEDNEDVDETKEDEEDEGVDASEVIASLDSLKHKELVQVAKDWDIRLPKGLSEFTKDNKKKLLVLLKKELSKFETKEDDEEEFDADEEIEDIIEEDDS